MIFTYVEAKKKDVIKILTDRYIFWKVNGVPYTPGDRVHIGLMNYLVQFKGETIALLQIDSFTSNVALIHGCVLTKYCKPKIIKLLGDDIIDLFKTTSSFNKIIAPIPAEAVHARKAALKQGFKEEAKIEDGVMYGGHIQDYFLYSHIIDRGDK